MGAFRLLLACVFQFAFLSISCSNQPLLFWINFPVLYFSESIGKFLRKTKACIILIRTLQNTCTTKATPSSRVRYVPPQPGPLTTHGRVPPPRAWSCWRHVLLLKTSNTLLSVFIEFGKLKSCFNAQPFYNITVNPHNLKLTIYALSDDQISWFQFLLCTDLPFCAAK